MRLLTIRSPMRAPCVVRFLTVGKSAVLLSQRPRQPPPPDPFSGKSCQANSATTVRTSRGATTASHAQSFNDTGPLDWNSLDVAQAPSHCAFRERLAFALQKLRGRLYSVYRPLDVGPADFERLLAGCEAHGDSSSVPAIIATFAAMLQLPLNPAATSELLAWNDAPGRLSKMVRRGSMLLAPTDALTLIRTSIIEVPQTCSTNEEMCRYVLQVLQGRIDPVGASRCLDMGAVASVAGALVRLGDKDAAMELAEAAIYYRLREGTTVRDVEAVSAECAEAAATMGNADLVARFAFVMFRASGTLGVAAPAAAASPSQQLSEWLNQLLGRSAVAGAPSTKTAMEAFEASLAQVLASSVRVTLINPDETKGLRDATALCNKLRTAGSWGAHCAMAQVIFNHMLKIHSGVPGEKTHALQTTAILQLASLADTFPREPSERQVSEMADCVAASMALFASPSHVTTALGRVLTTFKALNPLRIGELFTRLPDGCTKSRRAALPLMLCSCAALGRWDLAKAALSEHFRWSERGDDRELISLAVNAAITTRQDTDITIGALAIHCSLFADGGAQLCAGAALSDELLLLVAHSLAIASVKPPAEATLAALLGLATSSSSPSLSSSKLPSPPRRSMSPPCASEVFSAAVVHRHPSAAAMDAGRALARVILKESCGLELDDWRLLDPTSSISLTATQGILVEGRCSGAPLQGFGAAVMVDVSAVASCHDLSQFLTAVEEVSAEALQRSSTLPGTSSSLVLVIFSWNAVVKAVQIFGPAFLEQSASRSFCVASPLLCPMTCDEMPSVDVLAAGMTALVRSKWPVSGVADEFQSRVSLWIEFDGREREPQFITAFGIVSRRKLSATKALQNMRSLLLGNTQGVLQGVSQGATNALHVFPPVFPRSKPDKTLQPAASSVMSPKL